MSLTRPIRLLWVSHEIDVPFGFQTARCGRWQIVVRFNQWERARGFWPLSWRKTPTFPAPIFRWWALGPVEVRRYRQDIPTTGKGEPS